VIVAAVFVPSAPILIPQIASGAAHELDELRAVAIATIDRVVESAERVVIVGAGERTHRFDTGIGTFAGFGVPLSVTLDRSASVDVSEPADGLGLAASIGVWLLDQTRWTGPRNVIEISSDESVENIAALVQEVAAAPDRTVLLVVADGSAARTEKAPGYLHPDATAFDALVEDALMSGSAQGLASLDRALAEAVMAAGWPAWQFAAESMRDRAVEAGCEYAEAPYGVGYFVASWVCLD